MAYSRGVSEPSIPSPVSARGLWLTALGLAALSAAVFWACTMSGPLPLDPGLAPWQSPLWRARAGRLLAAAVAGAGLAVGGAAIQGLLRNPLAEPYILGISSGAGVGVRLGLALGLAAGAAHGRLPLLAFAGAAAAAAVVYGLARRRGQVHGYSLILSGVVVNLFNGALMMAIYLLADPFRIDEFARWAMGELPDAVDPTLLAVCGALVAGRLPVGLLTALLGGPFFIALMRRRVAEESG